MDISFTIILTETSVGKIQESSIKIQVTICMAKSWIWTWILTLIGPAFKNYVKGQGGEESSPPLKIALRADFGNFFWYYPWNIYKWGTHAKN